MNFIIPLHIYPFDIMFSVGESDKELSKTLSKFDETLSDLDTVMKDLSLDGSSGICLMLKRGSNIIRLKADDGSTKWKNTLSHEIFHAVCNTMQKVDITLSDSSEEAYAYLIGYITGEFYYKHPCK